MNRRVFKIGDLDRFPLVKPSWVFSSSVMVWDLETLDDMGLIAAASSDCSLYLLNAAGKMLARFENRTPVTQVRRAAPDLLAINGSDGRVVGVGIATDSSGRFRLHERWSTQLSQRRGDHQGVITIIELQEDGTLLAAYGNINQGFGGVAELAASGELLSETSFDCAALWLGAFRGAPAVCHALVVTATPEKSFSVVGWGRNGAMHPIVEGAALAMVVGVAESGGLWVSLSMDKNVFELLRIDGDCRVAARFVTEGITTCVVPVENERVAAACSPLQPESSGPRCNLTLFRNDGEALWTHYLVRQAFQVGFASDKRLLFVSSMGQGNVYSLTLEGRITACAKVEKAPMRFRWHEPSASLLVASADVSSYPLSGFLNG